MDFRLQSRFKKKKCKCLFPDLKLLDVYVLVCVCKNVWVDNWIIRIIKFSNFVYLRSRSRNMELHISLFQPEGTWILKQFNGSVQNLAAFSSMYTKVGKHRGSSESSVYVTSCQMWRLHLKDCWSLYRSFTVFDILRSWLRGWLVS